MNLGIYKIISKAQDLKGVNEVEMNKIISNIFENLNLSFNKAEKALAFTKAA